VIEFWNPYIIYKIRAWEEASEDSLKSNKEGFYLGNLRAYTEATKFVKVLFQTTKKVMNFFRT